MRRSVLVLAMGLFVLAAVGAAIWFNLTRARVLILHSYETEYVWVHDINLALKRVFEKHSWIDVRYHHMDTKKLSSQDHLRRAGIAARKAIESSRPDVVIAFDDNAQKLAVKYFNDHPTIKIVFAGLNGSIEPYGYHKAKNVTGIVERKPAAAIQEVLTILSSNADNRIGREGKPVRALFLGDKSSSVKHDGEHLASFKWDSIEYLGLQTVDTFEDWKKAVMASAGRADVLLVGGYRRLRAPNADAKTRRVYVKPEAVMAWTEANAPIPAIGMNVFNTEDGAMLSVGVSPFEQAEVAADMALRIIEKGEAPNTIPVQTSRLYVISLREEALKKRRIRVPGVFEAFARATDNYIDDRSGTKVSAK